jgi:hypothetical protein
MKNCVQILDDEVQESARKITDMNIVHYLSKKNEQTIEIENERTIGHGENDVSAEREKERNIVCKQ